MIKAARGRATGPTCRTLERFHTDFHLLDATRPGMRGGTGETFDWELLRASARSRAPLILSGGLRPGNVAEAIARRRPFAVDVASGVEAEPGRQGPREGSRGLRRRPQTAGPTPRREPHAPR